MSLALMAHRMKRMMCSRVVGPVDCQTSMRAWVSCSTVVLCSSISQLQKSIPGPDVGWQHAGDDVRQVCQHRTGRRPQQRPQPGRDLRGPRGVAKVGPQVTQEVGVDDVVGDGVVEPGHQVGDRGRHVLLADLVRGNAVDSQERWACP
jgi:hypothetical protein